MFSSASVVLQSEHPRQSEGLTRSAAKELHSGMAIVALNPGEINKDMLVSCFGSSADLYQALESCFSCLLHSCYASGIWVEFLICRLRKLYGLNFYSSVYAASWSIWLLHPFEAGQFCALVNLVYGLKLVLELHLFVHAGLGFDLRKRVVVANYGVDWQQVVSLVDASHGQKEANAEQPKLSVGMILIFIFAEALALYGLIVGIILSSRAGQSRAD
ncbi:hypothetical protein LOK49_LG08G01595 [Camellia lanceoleosa]|uniref:Uncharacterized protein n=1 Tax=Camellia lanceoleosa TaxID=1840588 RepID=A0ACC0GQ55_9ERIC|nr:hypothetical protein LOK49_LG08G01595 [Camellia lanceoleosa]